MCATSQTEICGITFTASAHLLVEITLKVAAYIPDEINLPTSRSWFLLSLSFFSLHSHAAGLRVTLNANPTSGRFDLPR